MKALSLVRKVKTLREVRYGGGGAELLNVSAHKDVTDTIRIQKLAPN